MTFTLKSKELSSSQAALWKLASSAARRVV